MESKQEFSIKKPSSALCDSFWRLLLPDHALILLPGSQELCLNSLPPLPSSCSSCQTCLNSTQLCLRPGSSPTKEWTHQSPTLSGTIKNIRGRRRPVTKEIICFLTNILAIISDGKGNAVNITNSLMAFI